MTKKKRIHDIDVQANAALMRQYILELEDMRKKKAIFPKDKNVIIRNLAANYVGKEIPELPARAQALIDQILNILKQERSIVDAEDIDRLIKYAKAVLALWDKILMRAIAEIKASGVRISQKSYLRAERNHKMNLPSHHSQSFLRIVQHRQAA